MSFIKATYPVRRVMTSLFFGGIWLLTFYFLWVAPCAKHWQTSENRSIQPIGLLHAYERHDRWLQEPGSPSGSQISLPTYTRGDGLVLSIIVSVAGLITLVLLYHVFLARLEASKTSVKQDDKSPAE